MDMEKDILSSIEEQRQTINLVQNDSKLISKIKETAELICQGYKNDKKVLFFGNGGSASQAEHFAAELVGRFQMERKALRALALTGNTAILTAVANDYDFKIIFSRQLEALAEEGDIAIALSTSGNSPNIIEGIKTAKRQGAKTIGLTGKKKNKLAEEADINIAVPSQNTPRIQEIHLFIGHLICWLVEKNLFEKK